LLKNKFKTPPNKADKYLAGGVLFIYLMELITSKQLAQKLNVSLVTIRVWIMRGKIKGTKVGDRWLFTPEQVKKIKQNYTKLY
jgi:excisionase family DNA binding protein